MITTKVMIDDSSEYPVGLLVTYNTEYIQMAYLINSQNGINRQTTPFATKNRGYGVSYKSYLTTQQNKGPVQEIAKHMYI